MAGPKPYRPNQTNRCILTFSHTIIDSRTWKFTQSRRKPHQSSGPTLLYGISSRTKLLKNVPSVFCQYKGRTTGERLEGVLVVPQAGSPDPRWMHHFLTPACQTSPQAGYNFVELVIRRPLRRPKSNRVTSSTHAAISVSRPCEILSWRATRHHPGRAAANLRALP